MDDERYMTTEVPERLLIEVKVHAARSKRKVRELVAEAVQAWLQQLTTVDPIVRVCTALDYGGEFRFRGESGCDYAVSYRTWKGVAVHRLVPDLGGKGGKVKGGPVPLATFLGDAPQEVMRRELASLLDEFASQFDEARIHEARAALSSSLGAPPLHNRHDSN